MSAVRYNQTEAGKAYQRAYQAARYERAKAAGLCLQCKRVSQPADGKFCEVCVGRKTRSLRAWQRRTRRARGVPMRRCTICREQGHDARTCPDRRLTSAERCRCGLMLPCDDCAPTAQALAGQRVTWE